MALIITSIKPINPRVILPLSVLILVLLLVSFLTVMFDVDYLISLTHILCFIVFLSLYIVLTDVLISSIQLHARVFDKLTATELLYITYPHKI